MTDQLQKMATDEFARNDGLGILEAQAQAFSDLSRTLTHAVEQARQHATAADERAAATQLRLVGLESRLDQAQAKLAEIGAHATEIARLVAVPEATSASPESEQHDASPDVELDPLGVLASLRYSLDTSD